MSSDEVNELIDKCILLVDKARYNYNDSEEVRIMLYLSCIVFVLFYNNKSINKIYNLFENTYIYYEDGNLLDIINKHIDNNVNLNHDEFNFERIRAFSNYGFDVNDTVFMASLNNINNIEKMDSMIHELNHIFVGLIFRRVEDNIFYSFTGFAWKKITIESSRSYGINFNEAINSLVSEEMVNMLIELSRYKIKNKKIKKYLKGFRKIDYYYTSSYEDAVDIMRPFYQDREINKVIKDSLLLNNYTILKSYVDNKLNDNMGYYNLIHSLDKKDNTLVKRLVSR